MSEIEGRKDGEKSLPLLPEEVLGRQIQAVDVQELGGRGISFAAYARAKRRRGQRVARAPESEGYWVHPRPDRCPFPCGVQKRFVDEYLIDLNATQAAIRAGYSAKTAQPQSARLLLKVMVRAAIVDGKTERHTESVMSAVEALERASTIGRLDIRQFYRDDQGSRGKRRSCRFVGRCRPVTA